MRAMIRLLRVAFLLTFLLPAALWAAPLTALAADVSAAGSPPPATPATQAPGATAVPLGGGPALAASSELPARRTASSRTYTLGHGLLQTVYAADAVNYRDAAGAWQPIDNTLTATSATPGSAAVNRANRYQVHVPTSLGAPVTVAAAGRSVAFALQGAAGTAVLAGGAPATPAPSPAWTRRSWRPTPPWRRT